MFVHNMIQEGFELCPNHSAVPTEGGGALQCKCFSHGFNQSASASQLFSFDILDNTLQISVAKRTRNFNA